MVVWNRTWLEWTVTGAGTAVALAACAASALWLARRMAGAADDTPLPAAADAMRDWLRSGRDPALAGWVAVLHAGVLFAAALTVVLHAVDARYRGFDWPLFAPPAVAFVLLWVAGARRTPAAIEERWLAAIVASGAVVMVASEGPSNLQALGYAASMLVLAGCAAARANTSMPSRAPTAAGSTL